jgi:ornithine carbamoyltransferase
VVQARIGGQLREGLARAELGVGGPIDDARDTRMEQGPGAHEARLERAVEHRAGKPPLAGGGERPLERDHLGVGERRAARLARVRAFAEHDAVAHDHGPDRDLLASRRLGRELERATHEPKVVVGDGRRRQRDLPRSCRPTRRRGAHAFDPRGRESQREDRMGPAPRDRAGVAPMLDASTPRTSPRATDDRAMADSPTTDSTDPGGHHDPRGLTGALEVTPDELTGLLALADRLDGSRAGRVLAGRSIAALWFERCLGTQMALATAIVRLGGHGINLDARTTGVPTHDLAALVARRADLVAAHGESGSSDSADGGSARGRHPDHGPFLELGRRDERPVAALADLVLLRGEMLDPRGRRLAIVWSAPLAPAPQIPPTAPRTDSRATTGNPLPGHARSLAALALGLGMHVRIACPDHVVDSFDELWLQRARTRAVADAELEIVDAPSRALADADAVLVTSFGPPAPTVDGDAHAADAWRIDRTTLDRHAPNARLLVDDARAPALGLTPLVDPERAAKRAACEVRALQAVLTRALA